MDQISVSITPQLVSYVRKKVKSGRYQSASEVVRDSLRRMQDEETRELRLADTAAADILAEFTEADLDSTRRRVRARFASMERGEYNEYVGRDGLGALAEGVKARGRVLLARKQVKARR